MKDYSYWENFLLGKDIKIIHSINHDEEDITPCSHCGIKEPFCYITIGNSKSMRSLPDLVLRKRYKCSSCCKLELSEKATAKKFTKIHVNTCKTCDKVYVTKNLKGIYCSEKCRHADYKENNRYKIYDRRKPEKTITCKTCSAVFKTRKANQKFCSSECNRSRFKLTPVKKSCLNCGKDYETALSKSNYCSTKCRVYFNHAKFTEARKASKPLKHCKHFSCELPRDYKKHRCEECLSKKSKEKQVFEVTCTCGKEFTTTIPTKKYCKPSHSPSAKERKRLTKRQRKKIEARQKLSVESWSDIENFVKTRPSVDYDLDHIIPLNHPDVCGLHNTWNFQWLKRKVNLKKTNKFDGTMDNLSWGE